MADVTVLRGGTIVDGTGAPGVPGDVAVSDGKIVGVGAGLQGDTSIDASGCVVAPGFIDIHTHYDAQVFWDPALTPSCYHGVTTVVAGNCGFSLAPTMPERRMQIARTLEKVEDMDVESLAAGIPWDFTTFPEYLASVGAKGSALNFAAYIGHTPLRIYVMGDEASSRTATPEEVEQMAGPRARGDGRRRRRVRHQLRHHPPRRRRPADPQPLVRPGRARGAVPGPGGRAAAAPSASTASTTSCTSTRSTTCSASSASRSRGRRC